MLRESDIVALKTIEKALKTLCLLYQRMLLCVINEACGVGKTSKRLMIIFGLLK